MSEDRMAVGADAKQWERDAQELRVLMESGGLTQVAAGKELDVSERAMRGYCSGREPVPIAVIYAMRWLVEHKPNKERYLQVHWKKLGMTVSRTDSFQLDLVGDMVQLRVNNRPVLNGPLVAQLQKGIMSLHSSYSSDRFRIDVDLPVSKERPAAELTEQIGRFGYRYNFAGKPSLEIFSHDGRSDLSPVLTNVDQIEQTCIDLTRDIETLLVRSTQVFANALARRRGF
jgi:hypothetical protein